MVKSEINIQIDTTPILDCISTGIINIDDSIRFALKNNNFNEGEITDKVIIIMYDNELYKIVPLKDMMFRNIDNSNKPTKPKSNNSAMDKIFDIASAHITNSINTNSSLIGDTVIALNKQLSIHIGNIKSVDIESKSDFIDIE